MQNFGLKNYREMLLTRPRCRGHDSIVINLTETGYDAMDWIDLAQDRDEWRAPVNTSTKLRVS